MKNDIEKVKSIIKKEIEEVVNSFGLELDKIILFGSRARGDYSEYSDWDILVVIRDKLDIAKEREIARSIRRRLAEKLIDVDVIVRTVEEFEYYKDSLGTVTREAFKEGIII